MIDAWVFIEEAPIQQKTPGVNPGVFCLRWRSAYCHTLTGREAGI